MKPGNRQEEESMDSATTAAVAPGPQGITVKCIVAGMVLFMASPAAGFMSGQSVLVDGGSAHL